MESKKYYYLKLKDNFYESDSMILLESMENGYLYSNILMKMYLRSLKSGGRLMLNDRIPYNPEMLSKVLGHNVDVVKNAIKIFKELDLIDILDNGAIYMLDIQNYIGQSSTDGDRKRLYRKQINDEKLLIGQKVDECPDIQPPEIDIDIEKEINNNNIIYNSNGDEKFIKPTLEEVEEYCKERKNNIDANKFISYYESVGWKVGKHLMKSWKACVRTWENNNSNNNFKKQEIKPNWWDKEIEEEHDPEKQKLMEAILNGIKN